IKLSLFPYTTLYRSVKYADYLIPPLRLSFKIISPVVYKKVVDECEFLTICHISQSELNPGRFVVRDVHNPVAQNAPDLIPTAIRSEEHTSELQSRFD